MLRKYKRFAYKLYLSRYQKCVLRNSGEILQWIDGVDPDVISVDFFDTLVYRTCERPEDVFIEQFNNITDLIPGISSADWLRIRISAQAQLTENTIDECHIDEIYAKISDVLKCSRDVTERLKLEELSAEQKNIGINKDMEEVLHTKFERGKEIAITTDTYLPKAFIETILKNNVRWPFRLFCSSDTKKTKRHGHAAHLLSEAYSGKSVVHIGDNIKSDVLNMRKATINSALYVGERQIFLEKNKDTCEYMRQLGVTSFVTPYDGYGKCNPILALAWKWAPIMVDFVDSIASYARDINADEIWFLARDSKIAYELSQQHPEFEGRILKYIYTSRKATHPIIELCDPKRYKRMTSHDARATVEDATTLIDAYRGLLSSGTKRILIVDAGWKGRVQVALQYALPDAEVFGFYFSLDTTAEKDIYARSRVFVKWDPTVVAQAAVEALLGPEGQSCIGYAKSPEGSFSPVFAASASDEAPLSYRSSLREYGLKLISGRKAKAGSLPYETRVAVTRKMLSLPSHDDYLGYVDWGISNLTGGKVFSLSGKGTPIYARVLGLHKFGNLWPQLAFWSVGESGTFVFVARGAFFLQRRIMNAIRQGR